MIPPRDRTLAGMGLGVLAYTLFSLHDASNKWLVAFLPVWQVLFFRSATIVIGCIAIGRAPLLARAIETPLKGPLIFRGLITLAAWLCYYTAARTLPLAQLLTLYFSAPLMTTLLAIPLLGEQVSASRWVSVVIGFLGVVVASGVWSESQTVHASLPTALVLIAACLWGYAIILMRQIARRETSMLQMFYQNLCFLLVTGVLTALTWTPPTGFELLLLLAVGVLGGLGQFSLFEGARLVPASVMATVEYSALIWGFILGYLIWGDIPSTPIVLGAVLILAAGLFLVVMERRAQNRA
ncbi:MAG: DMT family transporter [Rhodospirillales bacterium]|nr:DMT family transporter [Rhodospirillales bacterium]MDE2198916.1 DMT family transporter [Rhodospirillales bacterium]MDE2575257.1 DMT family transporter [Rhodospirillales bacterium]